MSLFKRTFFLFNTPVLDGGTPPAATPPADGGTSTPTATPPASEGTPPAATPPSTDKPAEGAKPDDKPAAQAPEKYEFKFPDGFKADSEILAEYEKAARARNLSQEDAQKDIDLATKMLTKNIEALRTQELANREQLRQEWGKQLMADKDYGGLKYKETVEKANLTLRTFKPAGEDGDILLENFAKGNMSHPGMYKFLANIADAIGERKIVEGTPPTPPERKKSAAENIYGPDTPPAA